MTRIIISPSDFHRALNLIGPKAIAFSKDDAYVVVAKAEADSIVRALETEDIDAEVAFQQAFCSRHSHYMSGCCECERN